MDNWFNRIPRNSFWHRFRTWSDEHLKDEDFADMYKDGGRPAIPPSYMIGLMMIQMRQNWSDAEVIEEAMFDDRVKYALGLSRSPEITCDRSTLCKFRARALEHDLDRKLLGQTLLDAAQAGMLSNDEDLVDSFMVAGAAAKKGTFILMHEAIRAVLRLLAAESLEQPKLVRADYSGFRKSDIDWSSESARNALLQELVADARTLVRYCMDLTVASEELLQKAQLLRTVAEQDIDQTADGTVSIAHRVAEDRTISTVDPQMRHGRKTTSDKVDGYKSHVMVQNVDTEQARLITSVMVTPANTADGEVLDELVKERIELTKHAPKQIMGDTAYGSESVQDRVNQVSPETKVVAPVPPSSNRKGLYSKADFRIDTAQQTVTCPAGHTVSYEPKRQRKNTKSDRVVAMPKELCDECPLRTQCVGGKGPRTIRVRKDETSIQEKRQEQASPEWQEHYRERSRAEHTNVDMTSHGGRQARYLGERKNAFQQRVCATVHNISEIQRVALAKDKPAPPREQCA